MKLNTSATWAVVALLLVLVLPNLAQQTPVLPGLGTPFEFTSSGQRIRVVTIGTGLVHPWSIAFLPDGHSIHHG